MDFIYMICLFSMVGKYYADDFLLKEGMVWLVMEWQGVGRRMAERICKATKDRKQMLSRANLFVCGISLTSGQLINELFPD